MNLPDLTPSSHVSGIVSCTRGVDPAHAIATGWSPSKVHLGEDYLAGFLQAAGIELSPEGSAVFIEMMKAGGFKWDPRETHLPSDVVTATVEFLDELALRVSSRLANRAGISGKLLAASCAADASYFKYAISRSPSLSPDGCKAVTNLHELQHRIDDVQSILAEPLTADAEAQMLAPAHIAAEALKRVVREREPALYHSIADASEKLHRDCGEFLLDYVPDLGSVTDKLLCDMINVANALTAYTRALHSRAQGLSSVVSIEGNGLSR